MRGACSSLSLFPELLDFGVDGAHLEGAGGGGQVAVAAEVEPTHELVQYLAEHHQIHVLPQEMQQQEVADLHVTITT